MPEIKALTTSRPLHCYHPDLTHHNLLLACRVASQPASLSHPSPKPISLHATRVTLRKYNSVFSVQNPVKASHLNQSQSQSLRKVLWGLRDPQLLFDLASCHSSLQALCSSQWVSLVFLQHHRHAPICSFVFLCPLSALGGRDFFIFFYLLCPLYLST